MSEAKIRFLKYWNKAPLLFKAIFLGFLVSTVGVLCWSVVATVIPIPWSFILMLILLAAALLIVTIEQSGLVVTFRLIEFPAERFTSEYSFLENVPKWAAWLVIAMISAVAGICEETGFRGYMQKPLEERYGPLMAIGIVSLMFVVVHLHQAWSGPLIVHIFFISVLFGTLAYASGSLIPGIIAHFIMDIFNFSFWWSSIGWQFHNSSIGQTGIDRSFIIWTLLFLLSIFAFVLIIRKLKTSTIK